MRTFSFTVIGFVLATMFGSAAAPLEIKPDPGFELSEPTSPRSVPLSVPPSTASGLGILHTESQSLDDFKKSVLPLLPHTAPAIPSPAGSSSPPIDQSLVVAVCGPKSAAQSEASKQLLLQLASVAGRLGASSPDALESSSETFVRILKSCSKVNDGTYEKPGAVAYKILQNVILDIYRVSRHVSINDTSEDLLPASPEVSPDQFTEGCDLIQRLCYTLTSREQQVLIGLMDGDEAKDIAETLDISEARVSQIKAQIIKKLRPLQN